MARQSFLNVLAEQIEQIQPGRPLRVAIDGVDTAGKTHLANELAPLIQARQRPVIRASIDGFHNPRAARYRQGETPEGYYLNSFNYELLRESLLEPFGPGGSRMYRTRAFDFLTDQPVDSPLLHAPENAILLLDGVFLLRPELAGWWDLTILVEVNFDTVIERAVRRDLALLGEPEMIRQRYLQRYIPGQHIYLETCCPRDRADIVIDNNDIDAPYFLRTLA